LGKLKHFDSTFSTWDGHQQFQEAVFLTATSLRSLRLQLESINDFMLSTPTRFIHLTSLSLNFPSDTRPIHIIQLMKWMEQAPLLDTVVFDFTYSTTLKGITELILAFLLINPNEDGGNVISPLLTDFTLRYPAILPSLLLLTIAQREAFIERLGEQLNKPLLDSRMRPFQTQPTFYGCDPVLGDGVVKSGRVSDYVHVKHSGLAQVREALNKIVGNIGAGEFDAVALSRISDPEERIRALCSLLDLEVDA